MIHQLKKLPFWTVSLLLFTVIAVYFLGHLDMEKTEEKGSFNILLLVGVVLTVIEVWRVRERLFGGVRPFHIFITLVSTAIVLFYPYKFKVTFGLSIGLLLLCWGYGLYRRTFYKPHPIMIALFVFCFLKLISTLWATDPLRAFDHIDYYAFFICLPIVSCFYRVDRADLKSFIYISFFVFLHLLVLTLVIYFFLVNYLHKPYEAFLSFDKNYLGFFDKGNSFYYIRTIYWSYAPHPSKVAWIFMTVWAMGAWLWREEKGKIIGIYQLGLYTVLLLIVSLILQARIAILGIFILLSLFIWVTLMKQVKSHRVIVLFTIIAFAIGSLVTKEVITHTSFFKDEGRAKINEATLLHCQERPFIGGGAGYETQLIHNININLNSLHNEFMTALSDQGFLGLTVLLFFHILVIHYGLKNRYFLGIYVLLAFIIFNATEGVMGLPICIPFFLYCFLPNKANQGIELTC